MCLTIKILSGLLWDTLRGNTVRIVRISSGEHFEMMSGSLILSARWSNVFMVSRFERVGFLIRTMQHQPHYPWLQWWYGRFDFELESSDDVRWRHPGCLSFAIFSSSLVEEDTSSTCLGETRRNVTTTIDNAGWELSFSRFCNYYIIPGPSNTPIRSDALTWNTKVIGESGNQLS
jgi:hypothetical protein